MLFSGHFSVRRTQVIDDESDYFATNNKWISTKERDALQQRKDQLHNQKHASRLDKKFTLDFAGRRVIEDGETVNMYDGKDAVVQAVNFGNPSSMRVGIGEESSLINPTIAGPAPQVCTFAIVIQSFCCQC